MSGCEGNIFSNLKETLRLENLFTLLCVRNLRSLVDRPDRRRRDDPVHKETCPLRPEDRGTERPPLLVAVDLVETPVLRAGSWSVSPESD